MTPDEPDKEVIKLAERLGVSADELKLVLKKLGDAGVKGAEAGKQLGIAFRKLKEQQNDN